MDKYEDFDGNEIEVGDRIIIQALHYKDLRVKTVKRITKYKVVVEYSHGERFIDHKRTALAYRQSVPCET